MADPLPALVTLRAEMTGELEKAQAHVQQLHADLASLDAAIRHAAPDPPSAGGPAGLAPWPDVAGFAPMDRAVLDTLRRAGAPLTATAIAERIIVGRGPDAGGPARRAAVGKRVGKVLRRLCANGMVAGDPGPGGGGHRWRIAAPR